MDELQESADHTDGFLKLNVGEFPNADPESLHMVPPGLNLSHL